ncbi:TPA: DUF551 domain-containing protein [Escherichia coli]
MTTMTKERLLTLKQWRETYGPGSNVVLPAEEAEELARIALASLEAVSDERAAYELFMEKRFGESVDRRRAKNGDREYMAWDMALGWIIWCHRAAMLHGAEPVSQTYKLPPLSSREVNDAAWKLHNMLTEHGPLNGCQFNNLKECFYEALKVAMRNYPVTPDGWISCSERMPDNNHDVLFFDVWGYIRIGWFSADDRSWFTSDDGCRMEVTHWMPLPEPPQEVK